METVLLATDGSHHAERAAEEALDLADRRDGALHVLFVVDRRKFAETALSSGEMTRVRAEDHALQCIEDVTERAQSRGVDAAETVRHGVPDREILDYADAVDASVIVVGEHGRRDDHIGGVRRRLARTADRELRVVSAGPPAA